MSHELNRLTWKEWRFLPVALTDVEVQARGEQLADTVQRRNALAIEQAAERKRMKDAFDDAESEITKLALIVNERREVRSVEVEVRANLAIGLAEEVRTDTGEIILSRPLEAKDKLRAQVGLPFDEPRTQGDA